MTAIEIGLWSFPVLLGLIFLRAPGDVAYDPAKIEAIRDQAGLNRPFKLVRGKPGFRV